MAELTNTFSWSPSRARLFQTCRRAYYFNHYGMWGGWSSRAPERARLAYRLKQLTGLAMWSGQVVHRTIEQALQRYRQAMEPGEAGLEQAQAEPSTAELQRRAREMMVRGWRDSLGKGWQQEPRRVFNLFEHYYGLPKPEVEQAAVRARDRAYACLRQFREGGVWERLTRLGPARWLTLEELQSIQVGDVPVWVQLDLAVRDERGEIVLIDWKTGQPGSADQEQVAIYGLYAAARWPDQPLGRLRAELHYLQQGEVLELALDDALLAEARQRVCDSAAAMRALLRDPKQNLADEEDFPQNVPGPACQACRFRELCGR